MDGKTVKTIKKPNANKKCAATSIKKMPKKSMTVTVTGKLK